MRGGYTKKEIQDAVLAVLSPLSVQGGGYLRVLKPYSGELDSASLMAESSCRLSSSHTHPQRTGRVRAWAPPRRSAST